ncbi:hypothetical protein J6590_020520 [Homalodisca vitripennis]|nr:hypothetical protein J6590_020520 [Homalodisca vitripennis]
MVLHGVTYLSLRKDAVDLASYARLPETRRVHCRPSVSDPDSAACDVMWTSQQRRHTFTLPSACRLSASSDSPTHPGHFHELPWSSGGCDRNTGKVSLPLGICR